ncbi:MaoC/PaaZ C-terminal domain-containing protein [Bradyrhizobium erythrophlei]|uniref:MaoC like domain-containing protein n=1 Tax=Bradyrhizobium erythrophlei TaxID=1437360 RepID=A0A1M5V9I6_9BRAD|nr:MaoC/PaaZ C-terminal domain-containing protein [Bradyrhizobium erythrophlei]SHH71885.1 MaoC like domain-containing protein [Bradyrhizobium erythrophlei]
MTDAPLASRSFSPDDQIAFARLSSDWNPMHLDQAFARRTQFGAPVVHGIHTLAWAANTLLARFPLKIATIRARFPQPLYLDERATISIRARTDARIEFEVVAANTVVAHAKLSTVPGKSVAENARLAASKTVQPAQPADLRFEQLADRAGAVTIGDDDAKSLFPALTESIGLPAVKALLATSQIVGMACPGLHSLFAGLEVSCDPQGDREGFLAYAVRKVDARFRSLQIDVSGSGIAGRLDAFARPAPPSQAAMVEISPRVAGAPFAGQRSLIVGGSRGLGEVTAKIVAAGGGHAVITYHESPHDAERVATEIVGAGGRCEILRYDAASPANEQLHKLGAIDCCYYFATPKIFQRKSGLYEPEKLRTFLSFYADGFFDLCTALADGTAGKLVVFYPSTVAIDEAASTTAEYAMAKTAGEILAKYVNEFMPGLHVICRRLPRILTDQTATVGVASADNALDVMLPIVYDVQQMARPDPAPRG